MRHKYIILTLLIFTAFTQVMSGKRKSVKDVLYGNVDVEAEIDSCSLRYCIFDSIIDKTLPPMMEANGWNSGNCIAWLYIASDGGSPFPSTARLSLYEVTDSDSRAQALGTIMYNSSKLFYIKKNDLTVYVSAYPSSIFLSASGKPRHLQISYSSMFGASAIVRLFQVEQNYYQRIR